ncbi:MAG TPA: hypothetical protein VHV10_05595 [Ktedonobacteraceae bacterium]|nr:hypothetical protein [Ktedonobacteraceae bacterium]
MIEDVDCVTLGDGVADADNVTLGEGVALWDNFAGVSGAALRDKFALWDGIADVPGVALGEQAASTVVSTKASMPAEQDLGIVLNIDSPSSYCFIDVHRSILPRAAVTHAPTTDLLR